MKHWIKLWAGWYESTSHALLSARTLHTGPHLLVLAARAGPDQNGTAWLVRPDGEPYTARELAALTRWPVRAIREISNELLAAGTMVAEGGRLGFPGFMRYQESASAARVRKHREKKRQCNAARNETVTPPAEAEAEAEAEPPSPPPPERHTLADQVLVDLANIRPAKGRVHNRIDLNGLGEAINAVGVARVMEVARHVAAEVNEGRAEPKEWGELWMYRGQAFARWLQRLEEGTAPERFIVRNGKHYQIIDGERYELDAEDVASLTASGVLFTEDG